MSCVNWDILGDLGSILAGVAAVIAAFFAGWSARSAMQSKRSADSAERGRYLREIRLARSRAESEAKICGQLKEELELQYKTLAGFSGSASGSWLNVYLKRATDLLSEVNSSIDKINKLDVNNISPDTKNPYELVEHLSIVEDGLEKIRVQREIFTREVEFIMRQNEQYRAKAINSIR